ncbi:MAG: hypothetical protein HFACDABA_00909 [Anaerolineales bacterium]|nr:hypothetical protein [Anaerolineales bacterium]
MKKIRNMTLAELAAFVQSQLHAEGIDVVLSGGAAVSLYSSNKYVSKDVDLINVGFVKRSRVRDVMENMDFREQGRYFAHPDSKFLIEFPDGPLSVGEEPVKEINEIKLSTGSLRVISPTDCVKDRLCAFYFWNDQQGLVQAMMVAKKQKVDLSEIERWSKVEGKAKEFEMFKEKLG